jgi:DNA polymerase-1
MREELGAILMPSLEADDLLGITATTAGNKCIIISEDKDLKTIPCTLYNPRHRMLTEVSEFEADYFFMMQTLTGDTTDGYSGCPSIGPKKAEAALSGCKTISEMWEAVVATYAKAKLSEEVALQQAQVARICRATEFNIKTGKVIPWTPPTLS